MLPALRGLLLAVKQLTAGGQMICVHLIGTSAQPAGADTVGVAQIIRELEVSEYVRLEPGRQPYLDALRTMQDADALLLLGSTDSHYTASKIFPCWLAKRPILGLFHAASTVNPLARELGGVTLVTYGANSRPESRANELVAALRKVIADPIGALANRNEAAFEPYSARGVARRYAALFDHISNQPKR